MNEGAPSGGTGRAAPGAGAENQSPAERSVHHGGSAPLRGRVRVVKRGARRKQNQTCGLGPCYMALAQVVEHESLPPARPPPFAGRPVRLPLLMMTPSQEPCPLERDGPRIMLLPLPELVRPPPLLNLRHLLLDLVVLVPGVAALVVVQGPEPRVQVGATNQNKRRERETERG